MQFFPKTRLRRPNVVNIGAIAIYPVQFGVQLDFVALVRIMEYKIISDWEMRTNTRKKHAYGTRAQITRTEYAHQKRKEIEAAF